MQFSSDASGFVRIGEAVPDVILEVRYYSTFNFIGDRIDGYEAPVAMMTREGAEALRKASDLARDRGYRLKIYDAYRPQMAVDHFVRWAADTGDTRMKAFFYPDLEKERLFQDGYIAEHSGHTRGSTVDLTLFDTRTQRDADMGGYFDLLGASSHSDYTGVNREQFANRAQLREIMMASGFQPYKEEWWHYTLDQEPYPDTYFTFPIR